MVPLIPLLAIGLPAVGIYRLVSGGAKRVEETRGEILSSHEYKALLGDDTNIGQILGFFAQEMEGPLAEVVSRLGIRGVHTTSKKRWDKWNKKVLRVAKAMQSGSSDDSSFEQSLALWDEELAEWLEGLKPFEIIRK